MSLPKPKCGWPDPADEQSKNGAVICRRCHGVLVWRPVYLRWEHDRG